MKLSKYKSVIYYYQMQPVLTKILQPLGYIDGIDISSAFVFSKIYYELMSVGT